jgi:16S rRNA processing protein RimM
MAFIELGRVLRPHGYSGALLASSHGGKGSAFRYTQELLLGSSLDPKGATRYRILEAAWMPKGWKLKLDGIDSEEQVKKLRGSFLFVDRKDLQEPNSNEFYIADLIGAEVFESNSEERLGTFIGAESSQGGQDLWWIQGTNDTLAVPATRHFVQRVEGNGSQRTIWLQNMTELK